MQRQFTVTRRSTASLVMCINKHTHTDTHMNLCTWITDVIFHISLCTYELVNKWQSSGLAIRKNRCIIMFADEPRS